MTREEAKELLPIIQAFAEGKKIQYRNRSDEWMDVKENEGLSFISHPSYYRIKPQPKYRPFKTQEECWNEMLKHQPFGWVKEKSSEMLYYIAGLSNSDINIFSSICSFHTAFGCYEFIDSTPFGIKEE